LDQRSTASLAANERRRTSVVFWADRWTYFRQPPFRGRGSGKARAGARTDSRLWPVCGDGGRFVTYMRDKGRFDHTNRADRTLDLTKLFVPPPSSGIADQNAHCARCAHRQRPM